MRRVTHWLNASNTTRIWPNYQRYAEDPQAYVQKLLNYVRTAQRLGMNTMPILWNGNMLDPAILKEGFWQTTGDAYVTAIVSALEDEPGLSSGT